MEEIKFKLGGNLSKDDPLGEYEYILTKHPTSIDLRVVHFKHNGKWNSVYYSRNDVEENFKKGIWIKV